MRLLDANTLEFRSFEGESKFTYAILSHTWGEDEVLYTDIANTNSAHRKEKGWTKILGTCKQARLDGLKYVWVDTCCIDKRSSAELSEAINSMYRWYQQATKCYVYLADFEGDVNELHKCRWFTRGWCLQELLAPEIVEFYNKDWNYFGTKKTLVSRISDITKIPRDILAHERPMQSASVAQRMAWASLRKTIRVEDRAYSLLGIFDVNMPLLYGEGTKAFLRLQEHVLRETEDHSILAWTNETAPENEWSGLFAESPEHFASCHDMTSFTDWQNLAVPTVSSSMISLTLPVEWRQAGGAIAALNCRTVHHNGAHTRVGLHLLIIPGQRDRYVRYMTRQLAQAPHICDQYTTIHIAQRPTRPKRGDLNVADHFTVRTISPKTGKFSLKDTIWRASDHGAWDYDKQRASIACRSGRPTGPIPDEPGVLAVAYEYRDQIDEARFYVLIGSALYPGAVACATYEVTSLQEFPKDINDIFEVLSKSFLPTEDSKIEIMGARKNVRCSQHPSKSKSTIAVDIRIHSV